MRRIFATVGQYRAIVWTVLVVLGLLVTYVIGRGLWHHCLQYGPCLSDDFT